MRAHLLSALVGLGLAGHAALAIDVDAEDFRRLVDRLAAQEEAIETFRASISQLRGDLARLRAENDKLKVQLDAPRNHVTQDQLSQLGQQLKEVEKNRTSDKQQILDALEKLKAAPPVVVPPPPAAAATGATRGDDKPKSSGMDKPSGGAGGAGEKPGEPVDSGPDLPSEFYEHSLAEGETLGAVIEAYNKAHGLKTRLSHVLKANPSIKDPKRLRVGQKIRIPAVKPSAP
jgi:nucleoid-associated protein YgaU